MSSEFKSAYEDLLDRGLPEPNDSNEIKTTCPFHDDNSPSMAINVETGAWHCFKQDCKKGGGIVEFIVELKSFSRSKAIDFIDENYEINGDFKKKKKKKKEDVPPIDKKEVKNWNTILKKSKKMMSFLLNERGITAETVEKYLLGWDGSRITIPVFGERGKIRNVRKYKKGAHNKVISYGKGYGSARLYPIGNLMYEDIVLCEGELDAILANQMGYKAITVTGGAGTWKRKWSKLFKDKKVKIIFDNDDTGRAGAEKIARLLSKHVSEVKIVDLPVNKAGEDITDFFVKYGKTKDEFDEAMENAEPFELKSEKNEPDDDNIYQTHLSRASNSKYYFKRVEMNVIVSGKDLAPYIIPKKFKATCTMDNGKTCNFCPMRLSGAEEIFEFKATDSIILELISCTKQQQKGILKKRAGIPKNCHSYNIEILKAQNVEEVMMMPELDFSSEEREYVIRRGFFVGHGMKPNAPYKVEALTIPEPWRQYSTHLIYKTKPSQDNISNFKMGSDKHKRLQIFQPNEGETIEEKFNDIAEDFTHNVTHIYGRQDLINAMDLVYHSVLSFDFQQQRVDRGWVEGLIIGDTRTGKSETAKQLMKHYKLGELVTGENTSFAGLIGGMQQTQKRWSITWGKIPLNDRRLIVLDEASGLSQDEIAQMSGVRSSGVAEITKIQTEKTHARTRLLWISNARDGKPMKEYGYGIWAIKGLIGKSEDIARFDFAVACASEDVPMTEINKKVELHGEVEHQYTFDLCKDLLLWAWSRSAEQIVFTNAATELILKKATEMGKMFSSKIPLVEGANQRIKLARLAIAAACRTYSTINGENVIVKPGHVKFVYDFLMKIYEDTTLGYYDFSEQINENRRVAEDKRGDILTYLEEKDGLGDLFLQYDYVRNNDIEYIADLEKSEVKNIIKFLSKNRMLRKTSRGFKKTPAFGKILKEWKEEQRREEDEETGTEG